MPESVDFPSPTLKGPPSLKAKGANAAVAELYRTGKPRRVKWLLAGRIL
jgi:hypothetical protein